MSTPELFREWHDWMTAGGAATRTIEARLRVVRQFAVEVGVDPATAGWRDAARFLGRFRPATLSTYYSLLESWFSWLVLMEYRTDDPMLKLKTPKQPKRTARPITVEQLEQMLRTPHHRRTTVMLLLGSYQGMRVSEIAHTRGEHYRGGAVRILGKGSTDVTIPMHELVAEAAEHMPRSGWWFPSHVNDGEPIRGKSVSKIISDLMTRADVPGTPHALRHFYGTESLRASGGNLELVRQLMRHEHMSTTAIYTQISPGDLRAAVDGLPQPPRSALRAA